MEGGETIPVKHEAGAKSPNALLGEKSPYLLQHAYNPVNWYPWGDDAFNRARAEDKPIFLSIGYATCHWCHVMARESFENTETAEILNEHFVCIKVDREERPDLDEIYMKAVQFMAGTGGWPLSIFLTPDLKPFYGGTYFPPQPMHGLPAFRDLLRSIVSFWHENREQLEHNSEEVLRLVQRLYEHNRPTEAGELSDDLLQNAYEQLVLQFDNEYGGFGAKVTAWSAKAPKFPLPSYLSFLLRYHYRTQEDYALRMVNETLYAMARGGIFDQLGGGFHRYSTDPHWLVPHFEKMLYDNALLARMYTEAFQVTGDHFFAQVAQRTLDWALREMSDPEGGFYSAMDADSEGVEGAFYVWNPAEIRAVLGEERGALLSTYFGVTSRGNFERGASVLYRPELPGDFDADEATIRTGAQELLAARNKRIRPATDDKILTAWNGLMISALAVGYQVFRDERYREAATAAAHFILKTLKQDGRLLRRYRDGEAAITGTLEDYAYLIAALLDLYEASFDAQWLRAAIQLNESMVALFGDGKDGGFVSNRLAEAEVGVSIKDAYDGPVPSGNSIAAQNLLRLAAVMDNDQLSRKAEGIFLTFRDSLEQNPLEHAQLLCALEFYLSAPVQIVLAAETEDAAQPVLALLGRHFRPSSVSVFAAPDDHEAALSNLLPFSKDNVPRDGKPTVYICERYTCKAPITELDELERALTQRTG
ncbi:MAG: thioredoxin domain-containing protein [Methanomicrobia archaeon]|nr:thioredoxin domain-containing protein [Methanomicrobia archaeon]